MKNSHKNKYYTKRGCYGCVINHSHPSSRGDNYIKLSAKIISYIYFTGRKRKLLLHLLRGFS